MNALYRDVLEIVIRIIATSNAESFSEKLINQEHFPNTRPAVVRAYLNQLEEMGYLKRTDPVTSMMGVVSTDTAWELGVQSVGYYEFIVGRETAVFDDGAFLYSLDDDATDFGLVSNLRSNLDNLVETIRSANDLTADYSQRMAVLSEAKAAQLLVKESFLRHSGLKMVLSVVESVRQFATEFKSDIIKKAASAAAEAVLRLLGIRS